MSIFDEKKPRIAEDADKKGYYALVLRVNRNFVNPKDKINIELYFTGYGTISGAKVFFYPSDSIFDKDNSYVHHSPMNIEGRIAWGGVKEKYFDDKPSTFKLIGVRGQGWTEITNFFDVQDGSNIISTETSEYNAPVLFELQLKDKIKPATYKMSFHFTYFNGEEWTGNSDVIEINVKNFFQRNEMLTWIVTIAAGLITMFPDLAKGISDIVKWLWHHIFTC